MQFGFLFHGHTLNNGLILNAGWRRTVFLYSFLIHEFNSLQPFVAANQVARKLLAPAYESKGLLLASEEHKLNITMQDIK